MTNVKLVQNERSWTITLITHIESFLSGKNLKLKRADGERTVNTGAKRMFPDVLIYGDSDKKLVVQGWEVKMPDIPITDNDFYEDSKRKAINLNLNSFFMWNFSYGKLYIKDSSGKFKEDNSWDLSQNIKTREDVETNKTLWKKTIEEVLIYINNKLENKTIESATLGEIVPIKILAEIINRNISISADSLKTASLKDGTMRAYLSDWWENVKKEYLKEGSDPYNAYSRMVILGWINRILFAHVIKIYHTPASAVEALNYDTSTSEAVSVFQEITNKCDFYNVFNVSRYSELIAGDTWKDLMELNQFLKDSNVSEMEHEAFQNILESSVSLGKRELIGQYTTPPKLAKILVGITMNSISESFIDPCCGTGTISVEALKLKKEHLSIKEALDTTWSSDKQSFPLQIASVNFTDSESINIPIRIFQKEAFTLKTGEVITFINPSDGQKLKLHIPEFSTISSNLPFVSSNTESTDRKSLIEEIVRDVKGNTNVKLSGRNDLYAYLIFKLWSNLKHKGRLGVITSNSWLGTKAGSDFFKALQHYYRIVGCYCSGEGKWFKNAKVVGVILVLEKKDISAPTEDETVAFGTIKEDIHELTNQQVTKLIRDITLLKPTEESSVSLSVYTISEIKKLLSMKVSINALFGDIKWLLDLEDKVIPLSSMYTSFRGNKTGQDEIFLLPDVTTVDTEFIKKGLVRTKTINSITPVADDRMLVCPYRYSELEISKYTNTLNWFNQHKSSLNKSLLLRKDKWTILSPLKMATLFTGMNPEERLFFGKFNEPTLINQRLVGFIPKNNNIDNDLNLALLNSALGMFYIEAIGFGRGDGVLDFSKNNIEGIRLLNPKLLSRKQKDDILDAFVPIKNRLVEKISKEFTLEDRINFDKIVLESFGILKYYENIKNSLDTLTMIRLAVKPQKRVKRRKNTQ